MRDYRFLSRRQYFETLAAKLAEIPAGERALVATMSFSSGSAEAAALADAMAQGAKRGVHVIFLIDAITLLANDHGLPIPSLSRTRFKTANHSVAARLRAIERLRQAGVDCHIINVPQRRVGLIQQGRSHIKCAVVGDDLFVGGCNIARPEQLDVMVQWRDHATATVLANWLTRIAATDQTREAFGDVDAETRLDATTSLLLDAGVPGQSLIYDEALTLIDQAAEQLYVTCQYFPGGTTARHLAAAQKRGVSVQIQYSHPRAHGRAVMLQRAHQLVQRARRTPANFFAGQLRPGAPKLHAKVLISEKAAMVGSHNYISQSVWLGTAELTLRSTDPEFGRQLMACIRRQVQLAQ